MSLDGLIEHIRAIGEEEVSAIQSETEQAVTEILSAARADAERTHENRLERVNSKALKARAQALNRAQIEALRIQDQARAELIDQTLARVRRSLSVLREDEAYPEILTVLIRESLDALKSSLDGGGRILLRADARDQEQVKNALRGLDYPVDAHYDLDVWGGVIATSDDQRIRIDNTLQARLDRLRPAIRRSLARKFSG